MSFVENNKKELQILAEKIKELDTVRDCETLKEMQVRKQAINLIESWIEELFGVKRELLEELSEEPDIYTTSKERSDLED